MKTTIVILDLLAILWVVAVMSDPWTCLVNVITFLARGIVVVLFVVPLGYGLVLAMNGMDGILGHVLLAYLVELVGALVLLGSLFTLQGIWSTVKSVAIVYQLMISIPCWFILLSIAYFTW